MPSLRTLLLLTLLACAPPAWAGGSVPLLTLTRADAFGNASGATAVEGRGSFNFEDVVEGVFSAGIVVFQGTHFVRFDQAGTAVDGTAAALANGLDATEVPALVVLGTPAPAPAALTELRADRVRVVLPAGFTPGAASVALYAVYAGQGYASNTLTVTLP